MLQDIIIHIPTIQSASPVIDCAVSLAKVFDAHLDAIAFAYHPLNAAIAFEGGATATAIEDETAIEQDVAVLKQAVAALEQFKIKARDSGVSHSARCISSVPGPAGETFAEISRLYDLTVVAQLDRSKPGYDDPLPEIVLFKSGRPMLMVPYIHAGPLEVERVLICWDGGRPVVRAVHDAMAFLRKAKVIDIVTINEHEAKADETSATALVTHLARHNLSAGVQRLTSDVPNIHNAILSAAADNNTDLIVMGGYGHSRFREFVLGGVTRGIFDTLTVPALVSH